MIKYQIENQSCRCQIIYTLDNLLAAVESDALLYYGRNRPAGFKGIYIPESGFWQNYKKPDSMPTDILVNSDLIWLYGEDIVAAAFFMLSRYEELFTKERDDHGRFPARASLSYKHGFLHRPVVDEYAEYLYKEIKKVYPLTKTKNIKPRFLFTHDLDKLRKPKLDALWTELKNLIRLRPSAVQGILHHLCDPKNPADTFDWLNGLEKGQGIYFFMNKTEDGFDLESKEIKSLIEKVQKYGYKTGWHFDLCNSPLSPVLGKGLGLGAISRNHYLYFDVSTTWDELERAGIKEDYTLAYADAVGFRSGTCRPYKVFSLTQDKVLDLTEFPLTMMDVTLYSYMGLSPAQAWEEFTRYFDTVIKYSGCFTMLWHNFTLDDLRWRNFYKRLCEYVWSMDNSGTVKVI